MRIRYREGPGSLVFDIVNFLFMIALMLVMVYPFYYVLIASLSDHEAVASGAVTLRPIGATLKAYSLVFRDKWIWIGYRNTILYVIGQVTATLAVSGFAAYALSKKHLLGGALVLKAVLLTMLFRPGIIPTFIVVKTVGLYDSPWSLIIPDAVNGLYIFIMRTFFLNMEPDLEDAARIDGCGHFRLFWYVVAPLSKAVIATIALFVGVAQWNSFFKALIYLASKELYPIQLYLREVVIRGSSDVAVKQLGLSGIGEDEVLIFQNIRYAAIIAGILPILVMFPFVQKHFIKGAMLGSIKG